MPPNTPEISTSPTPPQNKLRILGFNLLAVTDRQAILGGRLNYLEDVIIDMAHAGLRGLQIREKDLTELQVLSFAARIKQRLENYPIRIFVNSRVTVAKSLGLGIHLPEGSDVAAARKALGPDAMVGVSCHSLESAESAEKSGATFVMFGPVFPPVSKPSTGEPVGLECLSEICESVKIPVVAIGGITPKNAKSCMAAGAQSVATIGAILSADDPRSVLLDFMRALGRL